MTIRLEGIDQEEAWSVSLILPPGRHICKVTEIEETRSSNDNEQINIKSECLEGTHSGFSIIDYVVVTATTYGKVKQILNAAEVSSEAGAWDFDPQVLVGKTMAVYVMLEPSFKDPSKTVSRVAGYEAPRESDIPPDRDGLNGGPTMSQADQDIPF